MPFHATLTVAAAQLTGHYTALRLWKECVLLVLAAGAGYLLYRNARSRRELRESWLARLILAYFSIQVLWGVIAFTAHGVSAKALGYGWVSDTRYLLFFLVVWMITAGTQGLREWWPKLVFWPAAVVVAFGLLQYFVLPYDFMKHLGYSSTTIFPYEDINHNVHYIRVMSTLRGANPLGAYLVVTLSLLLAMRRTGKVWWYALLGGSTVVLILTFSRGAWLGLGASLAVLIWSGLLHRRMRHVIPKLVPAAAVLGVIVVMSAALLLRTSTTFQNVVLHTQANSAVKTTSDQGHTTALRSGLHDLFREPLGRGPGTAGPASAYNTGHPVRLAENYYVQIAQETGWLGLGLFLAICLAAARMLWQRRRDALALGLLAALAGVSIINLFSHAWADDTLAYLWWGLAAIALAVLQPAAAKNVSSGG